MLLSMQPHHFDPGNDPAFVNLNDPNLNYMDIATPIVRGDIMFVNGIDYCDTDLQIITWLAKFGTRMSAAGAAAVPQSCYVSWPAIRVTVPPLIYLLQLRFLPTTSLPSWPQLEASGVQR